MRGESLSRVKGLTAMLTLLRGADRWERPRRERGTVPRPVGEPLRFEPPFG
ncbi:hypothetical protein [Streptomyces wuyuanensis]|uniref:hypothetical protein n=1 Tax=Streptomyces wuyuanensis TaxID=1196353 RepID=UPI003436BFF7